MPRPCASATTTNVRPRRPPVQLSFLVKESTTSLPSRYRVAVVSILLPQPTSSLLAAVTCPVRRSGAGMFVMLAQIGLLAAS